MTDEDHLWLSYRLSLACRLAEKRTIEGVHFDLSSDELDRGAWAPTESLGTPFGSKPSSPRLIFPWTDGIELTVLRRRGEATEVHIGDTVLIGKVTRVDVRAERGELDHPHHRERRWAEIMVERSGGGRTTVTPAWQFQGVADVVTPLAARDYKDVRSALLARLAHSLNLADVDDILGAESLDVVRSLATSGDPAMRQAAEIVWFADQEYDLEAAMAFGYLVGRAEAGSLLPLAERTLKVTRQNRNASKRQRSTGDEVRHAAAAIIKRSPETSRRKCAEGVAISTGRRDLSSIEDTIGSFFRRQENGRYRPDHAAVAAWQAAHPVGG